MMLVSGCTWGLGRGDEDIPEMHRNLSKTVDIQTSVVQGDLEKAQKAAVWLLNHENQIPFPATAREHEAEMLGYAAVISRATDLSSVAVQTGKLAASCGSCHQAVEAGPQFVVGGRSPNGDSQEAQMVRHLWAADRMWEGLLGPSEEAWQAGARALAETEPALAQAYRASTRSGGSRMFLSEVNNVAKDALEATGQEGRAEVYGKMLNTCNRCHSAVGILVER
jgi:cytochrome c556